MIYAMEAASNQLSKEIEREASRPVVTSITLYDKDNFVNYSDTDSQTDYFHSVSLGINHLIEWFTTKNLAQPATVIHVHAVNGEVEPKHFKRVERLAKVLGYKIKQVHKKGVNRGCETRDYYSHAPCTSIQPYDYVEWYLYDSSLITEDKILTS